MSHPLDCRIFNAHREAKAATDLAIRAKWISERTALAIARGKDTKEPLGLGPANPRDFFKRSLR